MNKSKFLKKSLAMLLALMLVLAMIPLSASAAPSGKFTPVAGSGFSFAEDPTATAQGWNLVFNYNASDPTIEFETEGNWETVSYVGQDGNTATTTPVQLRRDDNDDPAPLKIVVDNNGDKSEHTITWTMVDPASDANVTSATIGTYQGVINNEERTIHFTLPFGYVEKRNNNDLSASFAVNGTNGASTVSATIDDTVVATNKQAGGTHELDLETQDQYKDIKYDVTVEEETGLTAISIGGYEGEFVLNAQGYETGTININVPSSVTAADLDDAEVLFTIGSDFTDVIYAPNASNQSLTSGESYDFTSLESKRTLRLVNADGQRDYDLYLVRDNQDTTIQSFTAKAGTAMTVEGTVDGENLNVTVPSTVDLKNDSIVLNFVGPRGVDTGTSPSITVVDTSNTATFNTNGAATLTITGYTQPIRLQVKSGNSDPQAYAYYTLTITKAEAPQDDPRVTSAKLTLGYGTDNVTEYPGVIDNEAETITFSGIPYATLVSDLRDLYDDTTNDDGETVYTFAKTSLTTLDDSDLANADFEDGSTTVTVTSDNGNTKTYTIVYEKAAAQTGKTISDFILSTADNENLKAYNNNKTFNVTPVAGTPVHPGDFDVNLPNKHEALYADFTLSQGAKLYSVTGTSATTFTEVKPYNGVNGDQQSGEVFAKDTNTNGNTYFVADESLVYLIDNGDLAGKTYQQVANTYDDNMTVYEFDVTRTDRKEKRLTSLSADDGLVTSTFTGTDGREINLTVPYSYVGATDADATPFFFDFAVSEGATFEARSTSGHAEVYSGGKASWNDTAKEVQFNTTPMYTDWSDSSNQNNIAFIVVGNEDDGYKLKFGEYFSSRWFEIDGTEGYALAVYAEDDTYNRYTIGKITVAPAETEANVTSLTANGVAATINNTTKTINVALNYGTNLGQVELEVEVSKLATLASIKGAAPTASMVYDLTKPVEIVVQAENYDATNKTGNQNVYTLTATVGDMFSDVAEDQWYYDYVLEAAELGIVKGNPDGTFKPNDKVTRADFVLMTVRMLGVDEDGLEFTTTAFTDVNDETYNAAAIQYCAEKGLIGGDGDGKFRPNDSITRQEAAKIIAEALELTETDSDLFTDDNLIHEWAEDYVYQCKAAGIFGGDAGTGNFRPTDAISRAETAKIMVVAYNNK